MCFILKLLQQTLVGLAESIHFKWIGAGILTPISCLNMYDVSPVCEHCAHGSGDHLQPKRLTLLCQRKNLPKHLIKNNFQNEFGNPNAHARRQPDRLSRLFNASVTILRLQGQMVIIVKRKSQFEIASSRSG